MKSFSLLGNTYPLPPRSHEFLSQYLERVEKYIEKSHIDHEYLSDIRTRLAEKLDALTTPIRESSVVDIVNDLGEPEDIFADVTQASEMPTKHETQGLLSQNKRILFGVAYRLAQDFKIPVLYVRVVFILLIFAGGLGVVIYSILTLLLPGIFPVRTSQLGDQSAVSIFFSKVLRGIKKFGQWVLMFFVLIVAGVSLILGMLGAIGGINLFGEWILGGQDLLSVVTDGMRISVMLGSVMMILIALGLTAFVLRRPIFGRYSWTALVLVFVASGVVFIASIPPIVRDFMTLEASNTETYDILHNGTGTITLDIPYESGRFPRGGLSHIFFQYVMKEGTGITLEIETRLRGQGASSTTFSKMNPLSVSFTGGILRITSADPQFREKVALTYVEYRVTLSAPKEVLIRDVMGNAYNSVRTPLEDYTPGYRECTFSQYVYDPERGVYYCDPRGYPKDLLDRAMHEYAQSYVGDDTQDTRRTTSGAIIASGTYSGDIYHEGTDIIPMRVFINARGEIWGEPVAGETHGSK